MSAAALTAAQSFLPDGKTGNAVKTGLIVLIAVVVIAAIIMAIKTGTGIFKGIGDFFAGIGEGIGVKDTAAEKKAKEELAAATERANSTNSPFNPVFYKKCPAGTKLKTQAQLKALANQIYDSVGAIYDDPESGFGAFKQCSNWCMVSQVAEKFNDLFGKDVYSWLEIKYDRTSQKEVLVKIYKYCFSLPQYTS
jgi:hypothetical protein